MDGFFSGIIQKFYSIHSTNWGTGKCCVKWIGRIGLKAEPVSREHRSPVRIFMLEVRENCTLLIVLKISRHATVPCCLTYWSCKLKTPCAMRCQTKQLLTTRLCNHTRLQWSTTPISYIHTCIHDHRRFLYAHQTTRLLQDHYSARSWHTRLVKQPEAECSSSIPLFRKHT